MRPVQFDGSSDLERARACAARLGAAPPPAAATEVPRPFLRFSRDRLGGRAPVAVPGPAEAPRVTQLAAAARESHAAPAPPDEPAPLLPGDRWSLAVETCRSMGSAQAALLLDASGLVVASAGRWTRAAIEDECARLVGAMDQVAKLTQAESGGIAVELSEGWITAVPVVLSSGPRLTLALLAPGPLPAPVRSFVQAEVRRAVEIPRG